MKDLIVELIQQISQNICQKCGTKYKKKSHLYRHIRQKHTNQISLKCTHQGCEKRFKRNSHVKRHMITHTREKPYKCTNCIMSFGYKHHLDRHIKHKHLSQYPKCKVCQAQFTKKKTLTKHLKEKHNIINKIQTKINEQTENIMELINLKSNGVSGTCLGNQQLFQDSSIVSEIQSFQREIISNNNISFDKADNISKIDNIDMVDKGNNIGEVLLFKCPEPGCYGAFTKNCSLKRHIKNIHEDI